MRLPIMSLCRPHSLLVAAQCVVLFVMVMFFGVRAHAMGERVVISVETYAGKPEDFAQFRDKLDGAREVLSDRLSEFGANAGYLKRLVLKVEPAGTIPTVEVAETVMKSIGVLQILEGSVDKRNGLQYYVSSRIYLGDLKGKFPRPRILVDIPFTASRYVDLVNTHQAIIAYCLAMDALRLAPDDLSRRPLALNLLQETLNRLADLRTKGRKLSGDIADLEVAANAAKAGLGK